MTDTEEQPRELAAKALVDEVARLAGLPASDGTESFASLAAFRRMSDAVLAAVTPVIRRQVAEEVRQQAATWHAQCAPYKSHYAIAWDDVADFLDEKTDRSHSTQPTEEAR